MNIKIDDKQLKQFKKMCRSGQKEFQYVTAEYLNSSAFRARELNIKNLQSLMTIRYIIIYILSGITGYI